MIRLLEHSISNGQIFAIASLDEAVCHETSYLIVSGSSLII